MGNLHPVWKPVPNGMHNLSGVQELVSDFVSFSPSVGALDDRTKSKLIKFTADIKLEGLQIHCGEGLKFRTLVTNWRNKEGWGEKKE